MSLTRKSIDARCRLIERSISAIAVQAENRDYWINDLKEEASEKGKLVLEGDQYRFTVLDGAVRVERKKPQDGSPAA